MLERASHAVEDALASDNNHPDDIARAVLMSVLASVETDTSNPNCPNDRFDDVMRDILNETSK
jgi:hypothetical protein